MEGDGGGEKQGAAVPLHASMVLTRVLFLMVVVEGARFVWEGWKIE
jgi:hypothetical protein